jgi:hypothetical protein
MYYGLASMAGRDVQRFIKSFRRPIRLSFARAMPAKPVTRSRRRMSVLCYRWSPKSPDSSAFSNRARSTPTAALNFGLSFQGGR